MAEQAPAATFRLAEQRAAAAYGLALSEQYLEIGRPVATARVIEAGDGPPVLLVHGGGGFAAHWLPLMAHLTGRRLIAVDRPGCGLTDGFGYQRTPDVREHAIEFLTGVADALRLGAVDILATSMGGLWSLWFALGRPERVRSLALLGCPFLVAGTSAPAAMRVLSRRGLNRTLERPATARSVQQLLAMMGHPGDLAGRLTPEFLELCVLGANLPGAASSLRSLLWRVLRLRGARPDCALGQDELRSLRLRPLAVWGSHDPLGGTEAARRFAAAAGADLAFAGRGHLPWLDEPALTATLLQAHLDRVTVRH